MFNKQDKEQIKILEEHLHVVEQQLCNKDKIIERIQKQNEEACVERRSFVLTYCGRVWWAGYLDSLSEEGIVLVDAHHIEYWCGSIVDVASDISAVSDMRVSCVLSKVFIPKKDMTAVYYCTDEARMRIQRA